MIDARTVYRVLNFTFVTLKLKINKNKYKLV